MANLVRFGVSIEEDLLAAFDALIEAKGWANRSDALRGLIRERLLEVQIEEDPAAEVVGTITLVYDHHHGDLATRLVDLQHQHHQNIISTVHVHIDEANCLEVLVVKGVNREVRRISDALIGTRGVQHGKLIIHRGAAEAGSLGGAGAAGHGHEHPHGAGPHAGGGHTGGGHSGGTGAAGQGHEPPHGDAGEPEGHGHQPPEAHGGSGQ
jgi:CopG family nickel-responsive transcriptional regulator